MWNSETLTHYSAHLSQEIRRRRQVLGLPFSATCLVLADAASVHGCHLYEQLRAQFEIDTNSILLHGGNSLRVAADNRVPIPGGWGATGAPNDAWHQYWHYLRRGFQRLKLGMGASLKLRQAAADIDLSVDGNARFQPPSSKAHTFVYFFVFVLTVFVCLLFLYCS